LDSQNVGSHEENLRTKAPKRTDIHIVGEFSRPIAKYHPFSCYLQMLNLQRRRLGSVSDNSAPSSDISEVSELCETSGNDWNSDGEPHSMPAKLQYSLGLMPHDTSGQFEDELELDNGLISEYERSQIESFFSGLGTEVSKRQTVIFTLHSMYGD
jgi:hypothetical protein